MIPALVENSVSQISCGEFSWRGLGSTERRWGAHECRYTLCTIEPSTIQKLITKTFSLRLWKETMGRLSCTYMRGRLWSRSVSGLEALGMRMADIDSRVTFLETHYICTTCLAGLILKYDALQYAVLFLRFGVTIWLALKLSFCGTLCEVPWSSFSDVWRTRFMRFDNSWSMRNGREYVAATWWPCRLA